MPFFCKEWHPWHGAEEMDLSWGWHLLSSLVGLHIREPHRASWALCGSWGLAADRLESPAQQYVTVPELWETRTAFWHGWICALAPALTFFRKRVEIKCNINSPARCRTSRGRTARPGGTQEKGPASNPRATSGSQLPGQTGHHSRASAAKYFYSSRFCIYISAEKWHPDVQGRKLLLIKMRLLDWFVFFLLSSSLVCRAGWINDQFTLMNMPVLFCLLPLQENSC